jgi:hypothetical protein
MVEFSVLSCSAILVFLALLFGTVAHSAASNLLFSRQPVTHQSGFPQIRRGLRFVMRQNMVENAVRMDLTPTASTLWPIYISHIFLHRRGFSFDAMCFAT